MKEDLKNKDEKEIVEEDKTIKNGFFKKVWYSITKIEKYPELSSEGIGKALKYLIQITLILSIIISLIFVYKTSDQLKKISQYINDNIPDFVYNNDVLSANEVIIQENENFGKIIIDTQVEDEEKINTYLNDIPENQNAVLVLKDRLILKEVGVSQSTTYNYKEVLSDLNITEFNKQQLVEYLTNSKMMPLYMNLFIVMLISQFITLLISTLLYVAIISIFGYITTMILKLKIRYVAIFNMAIYSMTLSTILYILYLTINLLFDFIINYFDIMYILLATIYMIASIFMIKIDFNKKQGEVQKIIEVENQIKEETEEKPIDKRENKKDKQKEDEEDKEQGKDTNGEEPEGSNA